MLYSRLYLENRTKDIYLDMEKQYLVVSSAQSLEKKRFSRFLTFNAAITRKVTPKRWRLVYSWRHLSRATDFWFIIRRRLVKKQKCKWTGNSWENAEHSELLRWAKKAATERKPTDGSLNALPPRSLQPWRTLAISLKALVPWTLPFVKGWDRVLIFHCGSWSVVHTNICRLWNVRRRGS